MSKIRQIVRSRLQELKEELALVEKIKTVAGANEGDLREAVWAVCQRHTAACVKEFEDLERCWSAIDGQQKDDVSLHVQYTTGGGVAVPNNDGDEVTVGFTRPRARGKKANFEGDTSQVRKPIRRTKYRDKRGNPLSDVVAKHLARKKRPQGRKAIVAAAAAACDVSEITRQFDTAVQNMLGRDPRFKRTSKATYDLTAQARRDLEK